MEADIDFPEKGKKKVGFKIEDTSTADLYCHHEGCKNKFDFKMDTSAFTGGKTLMGVNELYFLNNYHDPSLLRYTMAQLFYQDLSNGRKTGLINLTIKIKNGTVVPMGIYTVLESVCY